jgi:hypothetical protein
MRTHLLEQRGLSVSAPVAADFFRLTEGNVQMLTLAIDAARGSSAPESFVSHLAESRDIERYLMTTVEQRLSEDERAVMNVVACCWGIWHTRRDQAILKATAARRLKACAAHSKTPQPLLATKRRRIGKEYTARDGELHYNMLSKRERQIGEGGRAGCAGAQHFDLARGTSARRNWRPTCGR